MHEYRTQKKRKDHMKNNVLVILFALLLLNVGCLGNRYTTQITPHSPSASNDVFEASLRATTGGKSFRNSPNAILLEVKNLTDRDLQIDWGKTLFIYKGSTYGTFMFDGIKYIDCDKPKPSDMIFANSQFSKTLYPCALTEFSRSWWNNPLPEGQQGIYLTILDGDTAVSEKIFFTLTRVPIQK